MVNRESQYCNFSEICEITELSSRIVIEVIEHGIVEPEGADPESWTFDTQMITVTKRAWRLYNDLGIDWSGIALAIQLLDDLEQLRLENENLKRRLKRFVPKQ